MAPSWDCETATVRVLCPIDVDVTARKIDYDGSGAIVASTPTFLSFSRQICQPPQLWTRLPNHLGEVSVTSSSETWCLDFSKNSKDDLTSVDSDKFSRIFSEFENLYQKGKLFYESEMFYDQREQIADAEAFLDIANTMLSSVKSQSASGVSPAEFVNALVNGFGQVPLGIDADETAAPVSIKWKDLGLAVCSTVFVSCGCSTM
ncbi:hypothetical protein Bca101_011302 [Brassica carinata]